MMGTSPTAAVYKVYRVTLAGPEHGMRSPSSPSMSPAAGATWESPTVHYPVAQHVLAQEVRVVEFGPCLSPE